MTVSDIISWNAVQCTKFLQDISCGRKRSIMVGRDNDDEEKMPSVEEYASTRMVSVDSKKSVLDAATTMIGRNISSVTITDDKNKLIGILTENDIVKLAANRVSLEAITAGSLMSTSLVSISKNSSIEQAAHIMAQKRVRHLLVEDPDDREIVGIITTTDMARYLKQRLASRETESILLEAMYPSEEAGEGAFWR
ncbi:MAG TPA: CBS domain-containing protein [Nitrososphaera sp.]|nr:CBS domain-containing protein [Nitrososphaera sp.]